VLAGLGDEALARLRPGRVEWRQPMLATLSAPRFPEGWVYERKLDGVRAVVTRRGGGHTTLWSRNHKQTNASFPELAEALDRYGPESFVADGEIVAFDGNQTSFAMLQPRIHLSDPRRVRASKVKVYLYLFDLLVLGDIDVTGLTLPARKKLLGSAFTFHDPLRLSAHRVRGGERFFEQACERGWEGLIAKRAASLYRSGRSPDWLKLKCVRGQEFVVGGFTEPQGGRLGLGALLVGYYERDLLRYAGKVGTGFDAKTLTALRARLDRAEVAASPFSDAVKETSAHWVRPRLVVQVGFGEWTRDGRLRHPRYLGLRTDKAPAEVVRES
jgi:bifunctional non-homologous end joining protein LigD